MRYLVVLLYVMLVTACQHSNLVPATDVVTVKVPVPYCPAPPVIPECNKYTDALIPADVRDPGKVAQLTKLELACLRTEVINLRQTVKNYQEVSKTAADVEMSLNDAAPIISQPHSDTHK